MKTAKHRSAATWMVMAGVLAFSILSPQQVVADRGGVGGVEGSDDPGPPPLTPEQQASVALRLPQVRALMQGNGGDVTPQICDLPPCGGPPPASFSLSTYARHQHRWFYCGAAVVQVVSNFTWGYTSTSTCGGEGCPTGINKYNQHTISTSWTLTDLHGQTYLGDLVTGLNSASVKPTGFFYAYWTDPTWSEFHNAIKGDTWVWLMPLAIRVDPRHTGSAYKLASWAGAPPGDYGHYITARGYSGSLQSSAYVYYNDSSGGQDEHDGTGILGGLGAFSDKSNIVYETMRNNKTPDTPSGHYYFVW